MRSLHMPVFVLATSLVAGCASVSGGYHMQSDVDFTQYRTYDWGPPDLLPLSDPRLDGNPRFHDYLQGAIERQLAAKGYELAGGHPDLLIHYHAAVNVRIDVDKIDRAYGYSVNGDPPPISYERGTIVLDVVDARTNQVVWRGWAQERMTGVIDNRKRLDEHIENDVAKITMPFPAAASVR